MKTNDWKKYVLNPEIENYEYESKSLLGLFKKISKITFTQKNYGGDGIKNSKHKQSELLLEFDIVIRSFPKQYRRGKNLVCFSEEYADGTIHHEVSIEDYFSDFESNTAFMQNRLDTKYTPKQIIERYNYGVGLIEWYGQAYDRTYKTIESSKKYFIEDAEESGLPHHISDHFLQIDYLVREELAKKKKEYLEQIDRFNMIDKIDEKHGWYTSKKRI